MWNYPNRRQIDKDGRRLSDKEALLTSLDKRDWGATRLFFGYRLFLAIAMLVIFFIIKKGPLGSHLPLLFSQTLSIYITLSFLSLMFSLMRPIWQQAQAASAIFIDIGLIVLMMHASGGIQSGLGILIAVSIALGSMSLSGKISLLAASIATLSILAEQSFSHIAHALKFTHYTQGALLGGSFFALALLTHQLSRRVLKNEQLANRRGLDLENLSRLNELVIQQMQAGIVVIDHEHRVQLMNDSAWSLLGLPTASIGSPLSHVSPELNTQLNCWNDRPKVSRKPFRSMPSGQDLSAEFTRLGNLNEQQTLVILQDSAILTAKVQQMKLASLGRLTAGVAHEIRNPLGAISHAAQLMEESPDLTESDQRMTQIIKSNSQRVNEVVESILKLSRQHHPKPKPLVLTPWLQQQSMEIIASHGITENQFHLQIEPANTTLYADDGQLRQILEILIHNSLVHFTHKPNKLQVKLLAGITPESGGPFIELHDNGLGIKDEDAGKLFEPFYTTRNQGTGLGLYIAQQLSEANQIRIEYIALPTRGSCFRLSFPNPKRPNKSL